MLMIVFLHILGQGGILKNTQYFTVKGEVFWAIEIACYCAVNCYALISGYVGINARHKYTNLISLCLQLVFYSVLITGIEIIVAQVNGLKISLRTIIFHLFPSIKSYWFFSAYFCLFFFMPVLNYIVHNIQRDILKKISIFILIVFCGCNLIIESISGINVGYSFLWLLILYVMGGYFAKYGILKKLTLAKSMLGYLICIAITIISRPCFYYLSKIILGVPKYYTILVNYNSPTIVLSAVFLFAMFSKMHIGKIGVQCISQISPLTFGVYLVHCHPYIFSLLSGRFAWIVNKPIYLGALLVFGIAIGVFILCLIVDAIRFLLFKIVKMKQLSCWIEKIIGKSITWVCRLLGIKFNEEIKRESQSNCGQITLNEDIEKE